MLIHNCTAGRAAVGQQASWTSSPGVIGQLQHLVWIQDACIGSNGRVGVQPIDCSHSPGFTFMAPGKLMKCLIRLNYAHSATTCPLPAGAKCASSTVVFIYRVLHIMSACGVCVVQAGTCSNGENAFRDLRGGMLYCTPSGVNMFTHWR